MSVSKQSDDTLWKIKVKNNKIFNDTGKNKNFAKRSQDLKRFINLMVRYSYLI